MDLTHATAADLRRAVRERRWTGPTPGLALGHVQANLVIVPRDLAFDFLLFCQRNPKPCPVLDVTEPGDPEPRRAGSNLRAYMDLKRVALDEDTVADLAALMTGAFPDLPPLLAVWFILP